MTLTSNSDEAIVVFERAPEAGLETRIDESPFSSSTTDNWVARLGGLPPYIRGVCRGIMKSGHSFEEALPMAIGIMRTWAAGGPTWGKKTHASAAVRAKAADALAQWERMKAEAAAGESRREIEVSTLEVRFPVNGAGVKQLAGAYATGHPFHGNQHTGPIVGPKKAPSSGKGTFHPSSNNPNPVAGLKSWVVPSATSGTGSGSGAAKGASGGSGSGSSASSSATSATSHQALLSAVDTATTAYNTAKDTFAQTKAQQAQNVQFAQIKDANTNNANTNQQNTMNVEAVQLAAQTANLAAQDALNEAQAKLEDAMTAAGYKREDPEILEFRIRHEVFLRKQDALDVRDGFAGSFVGESGSSGAAAFLPAGPSPAQDASIKAKLEKSISKHRFKGHDLQKCERVGCGKPITDPVHHQANDAPSSKRPSIINTQICRSDFEVRENGGSVLPKVTLASMITAGSKTGKDPSGAMESFQDMNKRHAFKGDDFAHCQGCGQPYEAPIHGGPDPAQPVPPIPREVTVIPSMATAGTPRDSGTADIREAPSESLSEALQKRHSGPNHAPVPSGHIKGNLSRHLAAAASANNRNITTVEEPLRRAMEAHFGDQRGATINRLLGRRGARMLKRAAEAAQYPQLPRDLEEVSTSHSTTPPGDPTLTGETAPRGGTSVPALNPEDIFDQRFWTSKLAGVLHPHLTTAAVLAQHEVKSQVKQPGLVRSVDPESTHDEIASAAVSRAIDARAQAAAQAISSTTAKQLAGALQAGVARGESRDEIASRLEDVFDSADHARAKQIASTQAGGAYNEAGQTYAANLPDARISKVWLSPHDDAKTHRKSHEAANGQVRPVRQPFMVGGTALMHPGSTSAPASQWMGCRCTQAFRHEEQTPEAAAEASEAAGEEDEGY